jgi:hypothetical protein
MTSQKSFARSTTRRHASRSISAHDLTRRFSFKPRIEHLEDRLAPAGGALTLTVNGGPGPVTVVYGTSVALAGTATGLSNPNTNNGDAIQFKDTVAGAFTPAQSTTLTVPATTSTTGSFTKSTRTIPVGSYNVIAHDNTDLTVTDSTPAISLTLTQATTQTVITASGPATFGSTITYTATVSDTSAGSTGIPTGMVTFSIDGGAGVMKPLSASGRARDVVTWGTTGAHTVDASYAGDTNFTGSTATQDMVTVGGAAGLTSVSYQSTVKTAAAASIGATSLTVFPLYGALPSGQAITFGATTVHLSAPAAMGATTISIAAAPAGIANNAVSNALPFLSQGQVYAQPGAAVTATVSAFGNSPTTGGVVFTDTLNSNVGSVTLSAAAAAHATSLSVTPLPGGLLPGAQFRFVAVVKTSAAAAAGATSLTVSPLQQGLVTGMQFGFPNNVVATLTANANPNDTTISVSALSGPIASGKTAKLTLNTVRATGDVAITTAAAAAGATSISVQALAVGFASGTRITFGTVTVTLNAAAAVGATTLSVNATSGAIGSGTTSAPANVLVTNAAAAVNTNTLTVLPAHEALAPGAKLNFGVNALQVENVVSSTSTGTGATNASVVPTTEVFHAGDQLKFGNNVVTLIAAPANPFGQAPGATYAVGSTVMFFSAPTTFGFSPGLTYAGVQPGDTTIYTSNITSAIANGANSDAANPGDTTVVVADIGGTAIQNGTNAPIDNNNNPLFSPQAKTAFSIGFVEVNGSGVAVLPLLSPSLVLPGNLTIYLANGQPANVSPLNNSISAQYFDGALGGPSDPNFSPGPASALRADIISKVTTGTGIVVTPGPTAQFGQTVTITGTVNAVNSGLPPTGTVTFFDTFTQGGITTHTTLGTVTLSPINPIAARATFTTSSLAGGNPTAQNHLLQVVYNGDNTAPFPLPTSFPFRAQWLPSQTGNLPETISADTTTGTLSASPTNNSPFGSAATFIDKLTSTNGGAVHGGNVVFKDGTTVLGTSSVNVRGQASLIVNSLTVPGNPHTITAVYGGAGNFQGSTTGAGAPLSVTSLTHTAGVATATVSSNATLASGETVIISGATPAGYDGSFTITIPAGSTTTFTFPVSNALTSPATGTISALRTNLLYTITPGASTTTITGPATASSTKAFTPTTLTQAGGIATATFPAGTTFTSNIITISGATGTVASGALNYNGIFTVTLGANSFTYAVPATTPATATGTITATEFIPTQITVGQAFNLKASVVGAPGFTPTGTVKFVAESNARDALAPSPPAFVPFTVGTATLAGGIATLAVPATGPSSIGALAVAAGNGSPADIFELEAFYSGDANYTTGHSSGVTGGGGPQAAGAGELAIKDTGITFFNFNGNASGNVVTPVAGGSGVRVRGKLRPSADLGQPSISSATGGFPGGTGHLKLFIDGKQFQTASLGNSTFAGNSTSGTFSLLKTGTAFAAGQHTIVIQYMGDGLDGFLPPGSTTIVYTETLVAGNNALTAPKGSVAFSTAPKSTSGTTTTSTSSTTGSSGGLSNHGVDSFFASSTTTNQTPRTLAGALAKVHSTDDWLGGF